MVDAVKEKDRSDAGKQGNQGARERPPGGMNVSLETLLGVGRVWGCGELCSGGNRVRGGSEVGGGKMRKRQGGKLSGTLETNEKGCVAGVQGGKGVLEHSRMCVCSGQLLRQF